MKRIKVLLRSFLQILVAQGYKSQYRNVVFGQRVLQTEKQNTNNKFWQTYSMANIRQQIQRQRMGYEVKKFLIQSAGKLQSRF